LSDGLNRATYSLAEQMAHLPGDPLAWVLATKTARVPAVLGGRAVELRHVNGRADHIVESGLQEIP
jgi:hypothetical protein